VNDRTGKASVGTLPFNVNYHVRVKLLPRGLKALEREHEELREFFPKLEPWTPPAVDEEGYSRFQLWCLMRSLGKECGMGFDPPFDTEILIEFQENCRG
jgi:repressor LexA